MPAREGGKDLQVNGAGGGWGACAAGSCSCWCMQCTLAAWVRDGTRHAWLCMQHTCAVAGRGCARSPRVPPVCSMSTRGSGRATMMVGPVMIPRSGARAGAGGRGALVRARGAVRVTAGGGCSSAAACGGEAATPATGASCGQSGLARGLGGRVWAGSCACAVVGGCACCADCCLLCRVRLLLLSGSWSGCRKSGWSPEYVIRRVCRPLVVAHMAWRWGRGEVWACAWGHAPHGVTFGAGQAGRKP